MDLSIIAAVGSFVVSERVLKPKATVLVILGFILAYDLTTKTQDVSSLRVYRGPSLVAFTLMMVAYSLRTWRRNGVACDELIFLPGTQHGHHIGIEGPLIESMPSDDESDTENEASLNNIINENENNKNVSIWPMDLPAQTQATKPRPNQRTALAEMDKAAAGSDSLPSSHSCLEDRSLEMVPFGSSGKERDDCTTILAVERNGSNEIERNNRSACTNNLEEGNCNSEDDKKHLLGTSKPLDTSCTEIHLNNNAGVHGHDNAEETTEYPETGAPGHTTNRNGGIRAVFRHWVERHEWLGQLWTFFFNRSGGLNNVNYTYAPSGPAVFGAALDLSMPVLFNFHVFIVTFNHIQRPDYNGSDFYAKTLPIAFLAVLYARVVIPPARRLRFWGTMKFTCATPFYRVGVRDEFIGDCLTSWARILQDLVFATIYFFFVIWGTLSTQYGLAESGEILAESWYVHNVILPLVTILPLWLKYLQTLRQAHDANQRWPYLGNALKYLSAALVIIYGMTHPDRRRSPSWIACFILAMFYQIFWDVVMDWELFEISPEISMVVPGSTASTESLSTISSLRSSSQMLLCVRIYIVQPIQNCYNRLCANISALRHVQLRQRRLYKTKWFYWRILAYNVLTRFTWMCCYIPAYHWSRSKTVVLTSTSDVKSYLGVLLPAAEVFRRTLWGLLYLEKETIKLMENDSQYQQVDFIGNCHEDDIEGDDAVTINSNIHKHQNNFMPTWLGNQQQVAYNAATARANRRKQLGQYLFLLELCVWGASFVILGCYVAM